MIHLSGDFNLDNVDPIAALQGHQKEIYESLQKSSVVYNYDSLHQLLFELLLRENMIKASVQLKDSKAAFTSFKSSKFNPLYWVRMSDGYLLRPDVLPSEAIRDIFSNGTLYGFECSTAMVVIFYKAVLDSIREYDFNLLFGHLLVWNWNYDPDLAIITLPAADYIPGDVVYFDNPDFEKSIWRGENAVFLGNGLYFGHGIGIGTAEDMIRGLNTRRKPGATTSAYMLKQHTRLNYKYLSRFSGG